VIWTDLRILVLDTGRVWWRTLPQILPVFLLGWLAARLAQALAVRVGEWSTWPALVIFTFGLLAQLVAIVVILQIVGRELGVRELVPATEAVDDDRDTSLTRLVSITLLPFLGIYAAFGKVQEQAVQLANEQLLRNGAFAVDVPSFLGDLNTLSTQHPWGLLAGLIGLYLLRRVLDLLHDRTGIRVLGIAVALVESFFLLVVILGGIRIFQQARIWLESRMVMAWLEAVKDAVLDALSVISIRLPALVTQLASFLAEEVWPLFWEALAQPIIWLAVAALVFGSQVLSLAEFWRKGEPYLARVPGSTVFASHAERRRAKGKQPPPPGVTRAAVELKEALLGDIEDKYLPTVHSLRLILRAGVVFLGAYVAVYATVVMAGDAVDMLTDRLSGGRDISFWYAFGPWIGLIPDLLFEPLRICLLAVAFRRCLELFWSRSHDTTDHFPDPLGLQDPIPVDGGRPAAVPGSTVAEGA
jgi:hypothetical protein